MRRICGDRLAIEITDDFWPQLVNTGSQAFLFKVPPIGYFYQCYTILICEHIKVNVYLNTFNSFLLILLSMYLLFLKVKNVLVVLFSLIFKSQTKLGNVCIIFN